MFAPGCGHPNTQTVPPPPTAPVSLTVRDTAPAGITVLAFEATMTGAVLQPGNVSLLNAPTPVELTRLQTDTAFLSTTAARVGTYNSIALSLANPVLTIENDSNVMFTVGNQTCSPGTVCTFTPSAAGTLSFTAASFLTLKENIPVGLLLDINLANLINSDASLNLSAANGMTVTQLPAQQSVLASIEDLVGVVANVDAMHNTFVLQRAQGSLTFDVDATSKFTAFDQASPACAAKPQNFSCVVNGQIVEVSAKLETDGALHATTIKFQDDPGAEEAEGIVVGIGVGTPPVQFDIVVVGETSSTSTIQVGEFVRNQYVSNTIFSVDDQAANISGFSFATASDLQFGQEVMVRVGAVGPGSPTIVTENRVELRSSRFTATVSTLNGTTFVVNKLPTIFTANGITQIVVQTSALTEFENVNGVNGLASGDTVSVRGPLFQTAIGTVLASEVVRKR